MVWPLKERTKYQLYARVGGLLLAVILLDLALVGTLDAAVWVFVVALLLSGAWVGGVFAHRMAVGAVVSRESRRRAAYGLALALVVVAVIGFSRAFDVERTTFQVVLEVAGVGIAAFLVGLSLTVLRNLRGARSE